MSQTLDMVYYGREPVARDDARARRAGQSHRTEEKVYGRAMMDSPSHTMSEREEFRPVKHGLVPNLAVPVSVGGRTSASGQTKADAR